MNPAFDPTLLSRVEDAGLNASAPPQQRWLDGWLLRTNPGKAKRARCINAVALGRLPLADKLQLARPIFVDAGLPMVVRITPFTQPASLDVDLAALGWTEMDDTRVMVCPKLLGTDPISFEAAHLPTTPPVPPGLYWRWLDGPLYAQAVGLLRDSPPSQVAAHAQRLASSPVPYQGFALCAGTGAQPSGSGLGPDTGTERDVAAVVACAQFVREADLVGLYDVYTAPSHRQLGLAKRMCERLLSLAAGEGARSAYLQVDGDNHAARRIYQRLGFVDAYAYHYRVEPGASF